MYLYIYSIFSHGHCYKYKFTFVLLEWEIKKENMEKMQNLVSYLTMISFEYLIRQSGSEIYSVDFCKHFVGCKRNAIQYN